MNSFMSDQSAIKANLLKRHRDSKVWRSFFFLSTVAALVVLIILVLSIVNQAFGLVVVENTVEPSTLASVPLEQLDKKDLIKILKREFVKKSL